MKVHRYLGASRWAGRGRFRHPSAWWRPVPSATLGPWRRMTFVIWECPRPRSRWRSGPSPLLRKARYTRSSMTWRRPLEGSPFRLPRSRPPGPIARMKGKVLLFVKGDLEQSNVSLRRVFTSGLYRDGAGGLVREAEGPATLRPGSVLEVARSRGSKNYIRNVEAVGSNPITSTKRPRSEGQGGSPPRSRPCRRDLT